MRSFGIMYRKEMLEAWRSYKLIWIPIVFIILGLMQPITIYYLPDILEASGEIPPGLMENYAMPGAGETVAQALGQYGTVGMLVLALAAMNSLAGERSSGTGELLLVRPLHPASIVLAKWAAQVTLLILALGSGAAAAAYYTEILMGPLSWAEVISAAGLYGVWLLCAVSLTLLFSSWLRGPAAAFLGLLAAGALALAYNLLPSKLSWMPGALPDLSSAILTADAGAAAAPLISSGVLILLCVAGSALLLLRNRASE